MLFNDRGDVASAEVEFEDVLVLLVVAQEMLEPIVVILVLAIYSVN